MPMSRRKILLLAIAAFIAIVTVIAARSALQKPAPAAVKAEAPVPQVDILIAKKDLPAGSFIAAGDVEWKSWPATTPHSGLLTRDKGESDYTGAVVRTGLRAGEPVTVGRILKTGDRGFLAAVLSPGMRAMTVKITPSSGVAGFIFPNDYVDVILSHELQRDDDPVLKNRRVSQTVLENVRVLALDQKTNDQDKEAKIAELATVEVTPKQAEKLTLISQIGSLSLVLRSIATAEEAGPAKDDNGGLDPTLVEAVKQALPAPMPQTAGQRSGRDLTWDSDVSEALPPPPSINTLETKVQVYRGSQVSDMTFIGGN